MATLQMQKPETKTKNWTALFPEKQLTETQSMLFVKKLLAVAVSSVSYLRAIFPENAFGERLLEDLKLKILREDNSCPGACHVIQWMKGCFDALDKKYLRMILIGIYENPEDPDTVIEQYTFKFNYNGKNGIDVYRNNTKIMGAKTEEQTKKATIRLLRTLILLSQTLTPLPDDVMMTMKLFYYDEVTPVDYQPPGFKECRAEVFTFKDEAMNIKVGEVSTPFHSMTLKVGTIHHQLKYKDDEDEENINKDDTATGEETPMLQKSSEIPRKSQTVIENQFEDIPDTFNDARDSPEETIEDDEMPDATYRIPETYDKATDISTRKGESAVESRNGEEEANADNEDPVVICHCGVHRDDGLMILCATCETWQHAVCFAIRKSADAPVSHICATCAMKFDDQSCTDPRLEMLNESELQATCLWRRAMMAVSEMNRVTGNMLMKRLGTELGIANHIVKRLEKEGYIKTTNKNKRLGKLVDKEKILLDGVNTYFRTEHENLQSDSHESRVSCMEQGVEEIVSKASGMELQEKTTDNLLQDEREVLEAKKVHTKARKRAISTLDQVDEFEISNSQDLGEIPNELRPAKKLKASAAVHSLLV